MPSWDDVTGAVDDAWDATDGKAVTAVNDHKVGILKGTSYVLAGGAIVAAPFTGGGRAAGGVVPRGALGPGRAEWEGGGPICTPCGGPTPSPPSSTSPERSIVAPNRS